MKLNYLRSLAVTSVLLLGAATATAHDFEVNGIYYKVNNDRTTVSVTYKGDYADLYDEYSGSVTIPASVTYWGKTYSVTSIGSDAFSDCRGLTAVEIPNSVTSIGRSAFYSCSLTAVSIGNGVTTIGSYAFEGCSGLNTIKVQSGNQTYDSRDNCNALIETATNTLHTGCKSTLIPNSVTSIGGRAFKDCSGLTSIEIPNSVTSIGSLAFAYCDGLTAVEIPNSVTKIDNYVFSGCSGLTAVEIPNSVTTIGEYAFCDCIGLTALEIPNSVTSIGNFAFDGCSGLKAVSIGNGVTSIGSYAFSGCSGLTAVEIPNSVTSIGNFAFDGCSGLKAVSIGNGVTSIGYSAFEGCHGLTAVEIPNSVTKIDNYVFSGCSGLTAVEIPNSVTSIGGSAFYGCSGLTAVEIPNSVTSIGNYAFKGCSGLKAVSIGNGVTSIGGNAFGWCNSLGMVFYNAKNCTRAPDYVFDSKINITFVIGAEVEQIGYCVLTTKYGSDTQKIVSYATTPPVIKSYTFSTTSCPLYVPKDSYAKYWAADVWGEFSDMRQIENPVTKIELNKGAMNIAVNSSVWLTATITPDNATLEEVYWSSDAPTVASVDLYGKVKGLKSGIATITAMAIDGSGVKATCRISVGEIIAENLSLNPSELTLAINQSAKIMPITTPDNISNATFEWSSSNTNVAPYRTNSDGTITVLGAADGVATITCRTTDGSNLTATCKVTVGTGAVEGIEADAVTVRGENGVIRIEGAEGAAVEVYNAAGVCVYRGTATEVPVPQRGLYVVKVAGRATKIVL